MNPILLIPIIALGLLLMLSFTKIARIRTMRDDFEARLTALDGGPDELKIERESFTNGDEELKIFVSKLGRHEGKTVTLFIDGKVQREFVLKSGRALFLSNRSKDVLPEISAGTSVEIRSSQGILFSGVFEKD